MIWVLVDISFLAYRALHAVGDLEYEDVPTGVVYGVFHQLRTICSDPRVRSNKIAIFKDSSKSLRKQAYPEYKKNRTKKTEDEIKRIHAMRKQITTLADDVFPSMGISVHYQDGLESDDLMARLSEDIWQTGFGILLNRAAVMITSDGDLYQAINPFVHWFDPQRNLYYDTDSFQEAKGISSCQWGEVKAMAGCHTDCVKGIRGVGEATAIKFLRGELPPSRKTHQSITSGSGRATIKRNRDLVVLPHKATEHVKLVEPQYKLDVFFDYCREFGLLSILRERKAWTSFFHGTPFRMRKRGQ